LWDRRAAFGPFALAGAVSVIAGGLLAAIAAPAPTRHGVWAVAYLVLVLGISQIVLGAGQALLSSTPWGARMVAVTAAAFNVANIAVLVGVITDHIVVFDAGAVLLAVALVLFLHGVRRSARRSWPLYAYRLFIAVLVVSIPIGLLVTTAGSP
jgi:heme/copper-type cytochrome/quinol oxidase subunit 4